MQQRQLPLPADKGAGVLTAPPHHARLPPHEPLHGVDGTGVGRPGHGEGPAGRGPHLRVHQLIGRRAQQDRPGRGLLLEPRRHVQGRADRRGQPLRVLPETAHDHQARVQPHAEGEDTPGELRVQGGGGLQALAQLEGGQHRPPGMILLGHGRAKHGREALTGREREGARVVVQHLLGQAHHRLEQAIPAAPGPAVPPGRAPRPAPRRGW